MNDFSILKKGIFTGLFSALLMAAYFLTLGSMGKNTLMLHNIGKTILIVIPVFLLFRSHFHQRGKLKLTETLMLGGVFALSASIVLVISELILHSLFSAPLTPVEFQDSEIGAATLYFLLTLELFGYSLLSLFLGFQFYKNRKYVKPK